MHIVILGNSTVAVAAVEAIRSIDNMENKITVVSNEPFFTYSHPLLPNYLVGEVEEDEEKFSYRRKGFYEQNKLNTILGDAAVSIDKNAKIVELKSGKEIAYDRLIVATGGIPIVPPMEGVNLENVFTFTNLTEVKKFKTALPNIKKCVVVGGGLIGTRLTEKLSIYGVETYLIELLERLVVLALDDYGAGLIRKELEKAGGHIITGDSVKSILGEKKVCGVKLASGKEISCDAVAIAIGVRPNMDIAKNAGLEVGRGGVITDEYMRTSDPNIFSGGDIVETYDLTSNQRRSIPILPIAYAQGEVAGLNILNREVKFKGGFPMNSMKIGGIEFISMGTVNPEKDAEIIERKYDNGDYKKFIIKNNCLSGAIFIGDIEKAGMFNWMIKERFNVKRIKDYFLKEDFGWKYFDRDTRNLRISRQLK